MRTRTFLAAALLSASAVVSCDSPGDPNAAAYWTGCGAGIMETGGTLASYAARDDPNYATHPHYRAEWNDGFATCCNRENLKIMSRYLHPPCAVSGQ